MAETIKDFYNLQMSRVLLFSLFFLLAPTLVKAEFGFHAGSHFGYGRISNDGGSIPARSMGVFDVQFMPGYRMLGSLMPGLLFEYRLMSQLEETATPDFGGRGLIIGLGATFEPGPVKLLVSYDFRARHWYSGPDTTYSGSGFRFLVGYKFLPGFAFDVQYVSTSYDSQEVNGIATGLNNDNLHHWNLGFGASYSF